MPNAAAYWRDWRRRNPAKLREYRERNLVRQANRRARLVGAIGVFTLAEWERLCFEHAYCCAYCGEWTTLTADHRVSLLRGGTNWINNILPACGPCNFQKATMSEDLFRALLRERRGLSESAAPYRSSRGAELPIQDLGVGRRVREEAPVAIPGLLLEEVSATSDGV